MPKYIKTECGYVNKEYVEPGSGYLANIFNYSHNVASGSASNAEGYSTIASGGYSHAEGCSTEASGYASHAEGNTAKASGSTSHAEGYRTTASGAHSHAEGNDTTSSGGYSHAEGRSTTSSGGSSHAEGGINSENGGILSSITITSPSDNTTVTIAGSTAAGFSSHAEGTQTYACGYSSHSEGYRTIAFNKGSHAEGYGAVASGNHSHAEGYYTEASGHTSHAEGCRTVSSGNYSHAEGGNYSEEGYSTASAYCSHAEGASTIASGSQSHAEGCCATASGNTSHAEGYSTTASGDYSHAEGRSTTALYNQHAQGHYNNTTTATETSSSTGATDGTAFVIGNGTSSAGSNAFRVTYKGAVYGKSSYNSTGADYAEFFEWLDGNTSAEDRRGYFVTLDGDKIKIANSDDYILGIISGQPSVIGNADEDWMGRYVMDDFGSFVMEEFEYEEEFSDVIMVEEEIEEVIVKEDESGDFKEVVEKRVVFEPKNVIKTISRVGTRYKENPKYDKTRSYTQRADRPEWDAVGMLGVLSVRDDGTCFVNGFCSVSDGGIATTSSVGYRVIGRVSDRVVKIIFR